MGSLHLNLCQIFINLFFSLLCYSCPLGTVEKLLSWRPWRYWESLPWFHMTCSAQLNAENEFLGICVRRMTQSWNGLLCISVSSPKVPLSLSSTSQILLLCFLLAQVPLVTPQPSPLLCLHLCCSSALPVVAVPGLSPCPDLFISLFCSGAAAECMSVQGKGCLCCISLTVAVGKAVMGFVRKG